MQLLPSDKIEPIILKLVLSYPKYITLIEKHFDKNWMEDKDIGESIVIINRFFDKYKKLPSIETLDLVLNKKFESDREQYLKVSSKVKSAYSIDLVTLDSEYIEDEVVKYLKNAGFYWTLINSIDRIQKSHNVEEYMEKMREISNLTFDNNVGLDYLENIDEHIDELKNPEARLPLGINSLDEVLAGGMYKQGRCLAIWLGQTHIGKSLILSNIAANMIKNNKFALIISLEMSQCVYAERIDAHLTKEDINKLQYNIDKIKSVTENIKEKYPNAKLVIKEFSPASVTCSDLKIYIDKVIVQYNRKPDIILIDYLTLMLPNKNNGENSYQKFKDVSEELRQLSYVFERPICSACQLNRSGYNSSEVDLDKTSESMGIPQTADFVGILWQKEGDREAELLNMTIKKNRLGGKIGKTLQFNINYSNLSISDINVIQNTNDHTFVDNLLFNEQK